MKPEYQRILFCSDFSPDADYAFYTALDLAQRYDARLHLIHVVPAIDDLSGPLEDRLEGEKKGSTVRKTMELARQKLIDRYLHRLRGHAHYDFQVSKGVPIVEIIRFARLQEVDLIVLGAAGSSKSHKLHFGGTAENVARRAQCTVMCIRNSKR